MAITLVQHKVAQTALSQTTVAITVTSTAAKNLIVVATGNNGTRTVSSVTDNIGNTYVIAAGSKAVEGIHETEIWYVLNATAGVTTVTVTFSGAAGTFNKEGWVFEVSGFTNKSLDVAAAVNTQTAVSSVETGASVTTHSPGFIVGVVTLSSSVDQNPLTGNEFTSGGDISATNDAACSLISTTAAAHQPKWHSTAATPTYCSSTAAFADSFIPLGMHSQPVSEKPQIIDY